MRFKILFLLLAGLLLAQPVFAFDESRPGSILLETDKHGEAWYYNPVNQRYFYLGGPEMALEVMRKNSVKVNNAALTDIDLNYPRALSGLFLDNGDSLIYVGLDSKTYIINDPSDAFGLMVERGIGVKDLNIDTGAQIDLDSQIKKADFSAWDDYGSWWGKINQSYTPVHREASATSALLGYFGTYNRVKVLDEVKRSDGIWYKIDGGAFPGAYVYYENVDFMRQPFPASEVDKPKSYQEGEVWLDVDLSKNILTYYEGEQSVLSTYVSTGRLSFPTVAGEFRVNNRLLSTRMSGGPPRFPEAYDLKNVPYTMYYHGSYAVHGTYWHDKFGTRQSHGCTNLTRGDAQYVYERSISAKNDSKGLLVYNHY